jgi:Ca-activated chloride channel family protein
MTFQPILPAVLVVLVTLLFVALAVWQLVRRPDARLTWAGRVALVAACGLLLLRPGIPGGSASTLATDVDILLVIDTTASIVAEDGEGGRPRLDDVREDVQTIVETYPGARFGLITFDADAVVRVPLTTDTTALATSLSVLRPEVTRNSRGSSVGVAAPLLEETLSSAASVSPDRARMVFYFGDGEQTALGEPESFAGSAGELSGGAVLGYGTAEGGPMRDTSAGVDGPGSYIEYEGERALSVIDPENLQRIAEQLGVGYQQRSSGAALELPPAPTTATTSQGSTETIADLSWVIALVIAVLLAAELLRAVLLLTRASAVARPRRGGATS